MTWKTIKILQHTISYNYRNDQDIPEHEENHVEQMIIDGYNEGELCDSESEERGWWKIGEIKDETEQKYLDSNGQICPHCDSINIDVYSGIQVDSNFAYQDVKCLSCGKTWTDEFTLTGITLDDSEPELDYQDYCDNESKTKHELTYEQMQDEREKLEKYFTKKNIKSPLYYSVPEPLNKIPVEGKIRLCQDADDFFGNNTAFKTRPIKNPTWKTIAIKADEMMKKTGDLHHCFLEDVYVKDTDEKGIKNVHFSMGS